MQVELRHVCHPDNSSVLVLCVRVYCDTTGDEGVVTRSLSQSHAFAQRASNLANGQGSYILAFLMLSRFWPADGALRYPDSGYRPPKEALELLEASARRGYTPARMALAFRLLYGFELPSNCEVALQLYKDAAEESVSLQGTIESVTIDESERMSDDLIRWLQHANVVEEEQREYLFAVAKSDASVAFQLGVAMLSGRAYGIKKDVSKAIQYLHKAAKDMSYAPVNKRICVACGSASRETDPKRLFGGLCRLPDCLASFT